MNTRVRDESEVVNDQKLRKLIIDEINGPENQARKDEAYRRHMCNKDKTKFFVIRELLKQFDDETVREMAYSISNLSLSRKIIDKLARVYTNGVERSGRDDKESEIIQNVAKALEFNRIMKRANRYLRTHKNTIVGVLPCPKFDMGFEQYDLKLRVYQPHLYDVIEEYYDREKPMFVILSNYKRVEPQMTSIDPAKANRGASVAQPKKISDGKDQAIADKAEDEFQEEDHYIWWSRHYHFTTNQKGEIITMSEQEDIVNPVQRLPFENLAIDQDGNFWAEGGDDVFDGAVHVNCMITNTQHIGVTQGYGQFYMKGKNLPRHLKLGPNKAILMEVENKEDPDPQIGYASSSPKLQELKEQVVMYVALLLTTNNLSTKAVSAELSGSQDFASGISMIIDKAESVEDVQDQRDIFYDVEPKLFELVSAWQQVYKNVLVDDLKANILPQDVDVNLKFNDSMPIMSEKEKLENMKLRKELGLNSMIDLIMKDNPQLTKEEAEKRLMEILEDRMKETAKSLNEEAPSEPEGELEKKGRYFEDENGVLWEETEDGFRKVTNPDEEEEDGEEEEVSE